MIHDYYFALACFGAAYSMGTGTCSDFLQWLHPDVAVNIFKCLTDPSDLIRASCVSHGWNHFVVANGLIKQLCLKIVPQLSNVTRIITEPNSMMRSLEGCEADDNWEWEGLKRKHLAYAALLFALKTYPVRSCIEDGISASSTDRYPMESIVNTLNPRDRILRSPSYWSSKGCRKPTVPETLIYKLRTDLCVITEINIRPFQAYFQVGEPIYSAKSVQFRFGHPKYPWDLERNSTKLPLQHPADDEFVWTYTSKEFQMAQENRLQKFQFPEPVLCLGGFLLIELLGRIQKQEMDDLYYICIAHVQVLGQSLFPLFDVGIPESSGKFLLKFYPEVQHHKRDSDDENRTIAPRMPPLEEQVVLEHWEDLIGFLINGDEDDAEYLDWEDDGNEMGELIFD